MQKTKYRGWFSVNPYKRTNIYETDRQTREVGIYAKCTVCRKEWGSDNSIYSQYLIPDDLREFKIDYIKLGSDGSFGIDAKLAEKTQTFRTVSFIYSDCIAQKGEYTFILN